MVSSHTDTDFRVIDELCSSFDMSGVEFRQHRIAKTVDGADP